MSKKLKQNQLVDLGTYISIIIYITVAAAKLYFASRTASSALYADGLNSASDVISTFIILIGLRLSRKPNDSEHSYGHYRIEQIATLIAAIIMALIGFQALISSFQKLFYTELTPPSLVASVVALASALLISVSAIINFTISKKTKVSASKVIAQNNFSDAITALGAFIAIIAAQFNMPFIDVLASFIISFIILKTAFDIFWESSNNLIDGFDSKQLDSYKEFVLQHDDVKQIVDIKGRMLGNLEVIDITISVQGTLSVNEAHQISDAIESSLEKEYSIHRTHVHVEPYIPIDGPLDTEQK